MPSRRAYLATLAAAGLAGCIGDSPGSGTDSESPTATTAPGTTSPSGVTVEAAAVQYSYRQIEQVDWNGIQPADGQFVFATVDARSAGTTPNRTAFSLAADGEAYDPVEIERRYPVDLDVPGDAYLSERENSHARGWLAFDVPAQLDSLPSLRLESDSGSWEWNLDVEKATAPPPAWEYSAVAPAAVGPDETFDITINATNVGDGPGTFRGAVNFSYPMYMPKGFEVALDPGESDEASVEATTENADPGQEIEYGIRTPVGKKTVTVEVEGERSPTPSTDAN